MNLTKKLLNLRLKGSVGTGTVYLIGVMILVGFMGTQLTNGLVPTRIPGKSGTVVTPKLENTDTDPGKKNLQLYTFGFTTPAPTTPPNTDPTANESNLPNPDKTPNMYNLYTR